jgi:hypothetical protein
MPVHSSLQFFTIRPRRPKDKRAAVGEKKLDFSLPKRSSFVVARARCPLVWRDRKPGSLTSEPMLSRRRTLRVRSFEITDRWFSDIRISHLTA